MPSLSDNDLRVKISTDADTSGVDKTKRSIEDLDESQGKATRSGINWSDSMIRAGAVAAGIVASVSAVTMAAVNSAAQYEQSRVSFETMLGSADKAKVLLKQVSDFAAATPFELPQVVEGSKNLLAFGVAQEDVISTFRTLGNVAAGVGTEKLPNLIAVYGQVKAAGRMMSQDMLQFTSAGVPMIDLLSEHFGIAKNEVKDYVEKGKVGFDDLKASLEQLGGPAGRWGDLMEKQSHTFSGTMSNISDTMGRILRQAVGIGPDGDIRKGSLFDALTQGAEKFMDWLDKVQPIMDKIVTFFEQNKGAAAALGGALAGLAAGPVVALIVAIGWIPLAIVVAMAAIGGIIGFIASQWDKITGAVNTVIDTFKNGVVPAIKRVVDEITGKFKDAWGAIVDAIGSVKSAFGDMYNYFQDRLRDIKKWFDDNSKAIENVSIVIGGLLLPKIVAIGTQATIAAARSVAAAATTAGAWVAAAARTSVAWVISAAQTSAAWITGTLPRLIAGFATMAAQAVARAVVIGATFVAQAALTTAQWALAFARFTAGLAVMVAQFLVQAARMAAGWLLALGPIGLIIAAVVIMVALIIANWETVKKYLAIFWGWLTSTASAAWSSLQSGIAAVGQYFINAVNTIKSVWGTIVGFFGSIMSSITSGIRGAVSGFGSMLFDAGKNLVQGLINGVRSMVGSAISAARDMGARAADAVKSALGIHSPSLVFHEIGVNMGQGMVNGIESMKSLAQGAATNLAGVTASASVNQSRSTVAALAPANVYNSSRTSGDINITVNATTPESVREVFAIMNGDMRLVSRGMAMTGGSY